VRDETKQSISSLKRIPWFKNVGAHDLPKVLVLENWVEAIAESTSPDWEAMTLEALNQYREDLMRLAPDRWDDWNELVDQVNEALAPVIRNATQVVVEANQLPRSFEETVLSDFVRVCMEVEYSDVRPPIFFSGLGHYYAKGHFPCGWSGAYLTGQLIVY
jgi:hypothetical protein